MQAVTFLDPNNQAIMTVSMDVPRIGEQVGGSMGGFIVANVRHIIAPNNAVRVYVFLSPVAAVASQVTEQYAAFTAEVAREKISPRT